MTAEIARGLTIGQKLEYSDGRIATVVTIYDAATEEVVIEFDAETQDPKPRHHIKDVDFVRADPI